MQVKEISRTYSRSINARNYGAPESWVKVESTYVAIVESGDDPIKVSALMFEQAQKEVIENIKVITDKMKAANTNLQNSMNGNGSNAAPAPTPSGPRSL